MRCRCAGGVWASSWFLGGGSAFLGVACIWFAVPSSLLSRLVVKLQVGPVIVQNAEIPVDATVLLDGAIDVDVQVPVEAVLTGRDIGLDRLTVPIDTSVLIDEEIAIETTVAIDTSVSSVLGVSVPVKANLPIKMKVPVRQRVRVKDTIEITLADVRLPLRAVVPLRAKVPIPEPIRVSGRVRLAAGLPVELGPIRIKPADIKLHLE